MPSSGVWKMMKVAVLAVRNFAISASSMTTSAMQPLGRQRTKPARPISALSIFKPRPEGSNTPSGATTRISRLLASAVFSTMTVRPTLARSSAVTLWIRAHCSDFAPGGVSQRICQSLNTDLTAPWAAARSFGATISAAASTSPTTQARPPSTRLSCPIMPIVQSLGSRWRACSRPGESPPPRHFIRSRWFMPVRSCQASGDGTDGFRQGRSEPLARGLNAASELNWGQAVYRRKLTIRRIAAAPELWFERPGFPPVPPHRKSCHARGKTPCPAGSRRSSCLRWAAQEGLVKAEFLVEGAHRTMLVLKRLIAFVVTGVTVIAGGGAAWAGYGQPSPWELGLQGSASSVMDDIVWFHGFLVWLIAAITLFVLALLAIIVFRF